ncbi:methyl-accepting chemotaxis protein [Herbivorax sp. ANBcel31]|uniref:methyl-accepting chemotaxis protein n=1 Tax=Herbivorax sp. ANBcel31 TaxID=3069754 RepID=UPI0027B155B6|nr:methyl-accepting chemotaxis protein [Herbivorax sp. ANBcel31]MDQ2085583.1 methyl-accepting chemotaxis protein [Herbivorax sp. ANBcel31]
MNIKKVFTNLPKHFRHIKILGYIKTKLEKIDIKSLTTTMAIAFISVSAIVLLVNSGINIYINYISNSRLVESEQHIIADDAVNQVRGFVNQRIDMMSAITLVSDLTEEDEESQRQVMSRLLNVESSFRQLALLDNQGNELSRVSRLSSTAEGQLTEENKKDLFSGLSNRDFYISSGFIDENSFEPIMLITTPIKDVFGDLNGALVAEINVSYMWDVVASMEIGNEGIAYVVDREGSLIAFENESRVIRGENLLDIGLVSQFADGKDAEYDGIISGRGTGISGINSVITYVPLGEPDWAVMVEIPVSEANAPIVRNVRISIIAIFLGLALAFLVGIFISKRITKPIIELRDATKIVSKGDLDAKINVNSKNEIGELSANFNDMVSSISTIIRDIKKALSVIMDQSISLKESSNKSTEAAKSVVIAMEQISSGTEEQASEAEKTSEQTHNLGQEIDFAVSKAVEVEKITESTKNLSINSKSAVELLTKKTKETDEITKEYTEDAKKLNESMEKIQSITNTISAITKKTNLLSLNATIEAAKAGDAGQGFSVIAKEINNLSTQSKESAKMIKPILNEIRLQTRTSIDTSERAHKIMEEQMQAVYSTQNAFDEIISSMDNVIEKIIELNNVINKIEDVKTKTINSVITISSVSEQTAASTEEVTAASEEQRTIAEQVSGFAQNLFDMGTKLVKTTSVFKTKKE